MAEQKKSWIQSGFGGIKGEEDRLANLYGPNRVWIKPGTSTELLFIDDEPSSMYEHNWKADGSWKNWLTCLSQGDFGEIPCCELLGANSKYYVGFFTVVDLSKWTDKKGNVHQYEVKLLPAKLKTQKKLQRKKEELGKLSGNIIKCFRETDDSASVGDEFTFVKTVEDMSKVFSVANYKGAKLGEMYGKAAENPDELNRLMKTFRVQLDDAGKPKPVVVPFNYASVFEMKDPKTVRTLLAGASKGELDGGGSSSTSTSSSSGGSAEDIPF